MAAAPNITLKNLDGQWILVFTPSHLIQHIVLIVGLLIMSINVRCT